MEKALIDVKLLFGEEVRSILPRDMVRFIRTTELKQRFAVIQSTHLEGHSDPYFDEGLWRCLLDFVGNYDQQASVTVTDWRGRPSKDEAPLGVYVREWNDRRPEDRSWPAAYVYVRKEGKVELLMATEYWTLVGGPYPYSDSYTYSLYSNSDIGNDLCQFLQSSSCAGNWNISREVGGLIQSEIPQSR